MKRKRRNHSAAFKARVALAALKGDRTMAQLAEQFDVHPGQIQSWKTRLLDSAEDVFGRNESDKKNHESEIKQLHAKIGELTMSAEFLENALGRGRWRSAGP